MKYLVATFVPILSNFEQKNSHIAHELLNDFIDDTDLLKTAVTNDEISGMTSKTIKKQGHTIKHISEVLRGLEKSASTTVLHLRGKMKKMMLNYL